MLAEILVILDVDLEDVEEHVWELHVQFVQIQEDVEELTSELFEDADYQEFLTPDKETFFVSEEFVEDAVNSDAEDQLMLLVPIPFAINVLQERLDLEENL